MQTLGDRITQTEERLRQANEKLQQLKARQQKLLAQKRVAESKKHRSEDTRRKVLLGALLLDQMSKDQNTKTRILSDLANWLSREDDRELFSLPRHPQPQSMMGSAT